MEFADCALLLCLCVDCRSGSLFLVNLIRFPACFFENYQMRALLLARMQMLVCGDYDIDAAGDAEDHD